MNRIGSEIISGVLSGLAFIVFYFFMDYGVLNSAVLSFGIYLGTALITKPPKKALKVERTNLTQNEINQIIRNGREQVEVIRNVGKLLEHQPVQETIFKICKVADVIFDDFVKDPKDIRAARKFIDYYLSTTQKIVVLYKELSQKPVHNEKEQKILEDTQRILVQIEETFHKQLGKLQEDDYLDLETELAVLEMTIKSEGI